MRLGHPSPASTTGGEVRSATISCVWIFAVWMSVTSFGRLTAQGLTVREIPEVIVSSPPGWTERLEWSDSNFPAPYWRVPQDPPDLITHPSRWLDRSRQRSIGFYRTVVTAWDPVALIRSIPTNEPAGSRRPAGFVWIPPGIFTLGSPEGEPGRFTNEVRRSVVLTRGYWMSDHEVTQSEYQGLMGRNPSGFPGANRPVENVSWHDATNYCHRLNQQAYERGELPAGYAYRLPTEAEWECAARAGSETAFPWGDSTSEAARHAWNEATAAFTTHEVRSLSPNRWGLHDLLGNVWEWCLDWGAVPASATALEPSGPKDGSLRVIRGGSYLDGPALLRPASRLAFRPNWSGDCVGFRPVLAAKAPAGSSELRLRLVPELTLRGTPGATYRIEKTLTPQVPGSWQTLTRIDLGTNAQTVWTDLSERPTGYSYRALQMVGDGGSAGPLRPGEPQTGRPPGFVWIAPGTFRMGSPDTETSRRSNEAAHTVTLTRGYWMSDHEVTESELDEVLGRNETTRLGLYHPVQATWNDATRYCETLTIRTRADGSLPDGFIYRLPTEAEWEHACRAGTTTRYSWGDDPDGLEVRKHAWSWTSQYREVRQLQPNAWGLYDLSGNLWEWCVDGYETAFPAATTDPVRTNSTTVRVIRGGGYLEDFARARSAARNGARPAEWRDLGFRPVLARPL